MISGRQSLTWSKIAENLMVGQMHPPRNRWLTETNC
jgi:hypothetical protein